MPVLHAVTNDAILLRPGFLEAAERVMRATGARGALHLRARLMSAARLHAIAQTLVAVQDASGCWLVVNDRVDLALAAGARGVQLTSRSMMVADARRIAPALRVGASVHAVAEAAAAAAAGADWVVAGHVFRTDSHAGVPGRGVELIRGIVASARVPCIAIGGVRAEHVAALRAAGAHGVAAISGIWGKRGGSGGSPSDAERAAIDYLSAYEPQHGAE